MSRVVVTGAAGLLGHELVEAFRTAGHEVVPLTHADIDLDDPASLLRITETRPDLVVNAAAWTDVDGCARNPERAMRLNGDGAGLVAEAAAAAGASVVQVSTNEVFDGVEDRSYAEDDATNPINPYGTSKLAGERAVAGATDRYLVVRTAWLFGPDRGFPDRMRAAAARALAAGEPLRVVEDEWGNPTPVAPLAASIAAAAKLFCSDTAPRILHLAGEPPTTRLGWAREILAEGPVPLRPIRQSEYERPSRVPPHAVLATDRSRQLGLLPIYWRAANSGVVQ